MESTGYETQNHRPGGDKHTSNAGTRSCGKTLHSKDTFIPPAGSGSLKSADFHSVGGSARNSRGNSRRELQAEMTAVQSPVFFHPATPGSKPGVRKSSPVAPPDSAEFSDMVRNARRRPTHSSPSDLLHLDPHAKDIFVEKQKPNKNTNDMSGSKTCPT